jgi:hypothetical protein
LITPGADPLPRLARLLFAAAGIVLVFTGLAFFLLPEYAADNFPWQVSPFVAMTAGGWTLGAGMMALDAIRGRSVWLFRPVIVAVWAFALLELVAVVASLGALRTDHWLTWPYLVGLILGVASAVAGARALLRAESTGHQSDDEEPMPGWLRLVYVAFTIVALGLAVAALTLDLTNGRVVPEPLTPFSARGFAAFLAALGLGTLPLLVSRRAAPGVEYARTGLYPIVLILTAAVIFSASFDFATRPGGLLYVGAYVLAGVVALAILIWYRRLTGTPIWRR